MFERLIGSMKRCLWKVIGQARLSYGELLTAVVEVESTINSRPLTYTSADDTEEPLTPTHLLVGRRLLNLPDYLQCSSEEDANDIEPSVLDRRTRHLNLTLNRFWGRWRKEYLLELREAHCYHHGNANPSKVSVDDVVLIHSSEQPRTFWRLGRVKELLVGKDGEVRGAVLRVSGGRKPTVLQRPIQLLYPLEIPPSHPKRPEHTVETNAESQTVSRGPIEEPRLLDKFDGPTTPQRPRRAAATMARDRLMAHALSED